MEMVKGISSSYLPAAGRPLKKCRHGVDDTGYTVDIDHLLFTPDRDFLIRNKGRKQVSIHDLKDKTIVLYIVPIYDFYLRPADDLDMLEAYHELVPLGDVEFVFVPVYIDHISQVEFDRPPGIFKSKDALFTHLFEKLPWPAVPFSDIETCGKLVVDTFSVDDPDIDLPYWVIIGPDTTVLATRSLSPFLFKLFWGAELRPFSSHHMSTLWDQVNMSSRKSLINNWEQLLVSPGRDFLLSSTGEKVPALSSLRGKVIGFYFCQNLPSPPYMETLRKVYQEAKTRDLDFEIVQINFHYKAFSHHCLYYKALDVSVMPRYQDIAWLTLPFKDPRCRKLHRLFGLDDMEYTWTGSSLVIVDARAPGDAQQLPFEFSGAEIIQHYGIQGYPFTREYLVETEYNIQKQKLNFRSLFPPKECRVGLLPGRLLDVSHLSGKRLLVVFLSSEYKASEFLSLLRSQYFQQIDDGDKFEVVCMSTDPNESLYTGMPWLVHNSDSYFARKCRDKIFQTTAQGIGAVAFDRDGQLIAKECLFFTWPQEEHHKPEFPFVQDFKGRVQDEVECMCELDRYYKSEFSDDDDEAS